jgi:uncharacterized damage-inducible protein DinB
LVELAKYATARLLGRLEGLTDQEYLWEPVANCWSVRQTGDGLWRADIGPHGTAVSGEVSRSCPPVTTIAWRMWHLGATPAPGWPPYDVDSGTAFVKAWFEQGATPDIGVGSADAAIDLLRTNWSRFATLSASFSDEELFEGMGDAAAHYRDSSLYSLLLHIVDELIHHGAEVAVMRDLYAAAGGAGLPDHTP